MARYIDADKLKTRIAPESDFRNTLSEWIDLQETEDVAPVVHAHWEEYYGDAKCTSCGFVCGDSFYLGSARFCPNCGAKMDEVET